MQSPSSLSVCSFSEENSHKDMQLEIFAISKTDDQFSTIPDTDGLIITAGMKATGRNIPDIRKNNDVVDSKQISGHYWTISSKYFNRNRMEKPIMSRTWQYMGFTPAATAILEESVKIGTKAIIEFNLVGEVLSCETEDCFAPAYSKEEYARENPWYEDENILYRYTFDDGRVLEDYVQAEPWSSGPCTFMALRDAETKEPLPETLWPQKDIDEA